MSENNGEKRLASVDDMLEKLREQDYRCALSGVKLTPEVCEVDHIIPIEDGGDDSRENLHLVHQTVHTMRGTLPIDTFIKFCKKITKHYLASRDE